MTNADKVARYGVIVGRFKSKTTDKVYQVRHKGNDYNIQRYSCNCPAWVHLRLCEHIKKVLDRFLAKKLKRNLEGQI
jgi:hypothetical protein